MNLVAPNQPMPYFQARKSTHFFAANPTNARMRAVKSIIKRDASGIIFTCPLQEYAPAKRQCDTGHVHAHGIELMAARALELMAAVR